MFIILSFLQGATRLTDSQPAQPMSGNLNLTRLTQTTNTEQLVDLDFSMQKITCDRVEIITDALKDYTHRVVRLFLSENYITDAGLRKILDSAKENDVYLRYIDLENNHISKAGLSHIKELLQSYPEAEVTLPINPIGFNDLRDVFSDAPELLQKIRY
jgi:hypothetical protein